MSAVSEELDLWLSKEFTINDGNVSIVFRDRGFSQTDSAGK